MIKKCNLLHIGLDSQVENHFESQTHDVGTQVEHLIASTQKKNTLESLIKRPDKTGSVLIKSDIS
jgi:hypothetical protein